MVIPLVFVCWVVAAAEGFEAAQERVDASVEAGAFAGVEVLVVDFAWCEWYGAEAFGFEVADAVVELVGHGCSSAWTWSTAARAISMGGIQRPSRPPHGMGFSSGVIVLRT